MGNPWPTRLMSEGCEPPQLLRSASEELHPNCSTLWQIRMPLVTPPHCRGQRVAQGGCPANSRVRAWNAECKVSCKFKKSLHLLHLHSNFEKPRCFGICPLQPVFVLSTNVSTVAFPSEHFLLLQAQKAGLNIEWDSQYTNNEAAEHRLVFLFYPTSTVPPACRQKG